MDCQSPNRIAILVPAYEVQRFEVCSFLHVQPDFSLANLFNLVALFSGDAVLLVDVDDLLDFIVTSQEDSASVVDILWYDFQHPSHVAVYGLPTS